MIYLDNASTTKMDSNALEVYNHFAAENFYNPSSIHKKGVEVSLQIAKAKRTILSCLSPSKKGEIIFTSGATEANNLAIFGSLKSNAKKVVLTSFEHDSVYACANALKQKNIEVVFANTLSNGEVDLQHLESLLCDDVALISVVHISNETGAINNIKEINNLRNKYCKNAILQVDGVQAFFKTNTNLDVLGADFYTISAHKINGPKGVGALWCKNKNILKPQILGGGQQQNLRSGTENVGAIMAFESVCKNGFSSKIVQHYKTLKTEFINNLDSNIYTLNSNENCSAHIISISFKDVNGETIVHMLSELDILLSTGSACSGSKVGNRALASMGKSKQEITGAVRISFDKNTTIQDVQTAAKALTEVYYKLKGKLNK